MNLDIRDNVINNFKGNNKQEILDTITIAINGKDELVLPGLGVLFEIVWNNSNKKTQNDILEIIEKKVN